MRWPWNRRRDVDVVPAEIREYYQTERRERTGIAWLLALGTLIITVALAILLFFGGRWLYRTIFDNDNSGTETAQVDDGQREESQAPSPESSASDSNSETSQPSTSLPSSNTDEEEGVVSPEGPAVTPVTGPGLPETGPTDTLAIFIAVSVFGFLVHRTFLSKE